MTLRHELAHVRSSVTRTASSPPIPRAGGLWPGVLAVAIAALVLLPIAAVIWLAFFPQENIWPRLMATTLPRYLGNTVYLMVFVGLGAAMIGSVTAWLVTLYRFPGRAWLQWALLTPLAIPAYVGAYALVDFLEFAGPLQSALRDWFGWETSRDYWFPQVRTRGFAALVLTAALYPYCYLLSRAALREQSGAVFEVARALGAGGARLFWRVGLPLARPGLVAGAAIAMMETVADFGVVDYFAVQTLTTGIFATWLEAGNAGGAAQIALVALAVIFVLVAFEKISRRNMRFHQTGRHRRPLLPMTLTGGRGWLAALACGLPVLVGFVLPVSVMASHAFANVQEWLDPQLLRALGNTLAVAGVTAVVTTLAAGALVYGVRQSGRGLPRLVLPATALGYAAPGAVLGLGVLIPMAAADHVIADWIVAATGYEPGLLMTGTAFAIVFACSVRFFAIAQGAADAAMGRVPPSLPMAARTLGRTSAGVLWSIYVPLMRSSVGTALLLVFVDTVKELPATLLLRPFDFNTLATRVYEKASLEHIGQAAPPALLVCAVGLCAVVLLARSHR